MKCKSNTVKERVGQSSSVSTEVFSEYSSSYTITVADRISLLEESWNQLSEKELLSSSYLGAVESAAPFDMDFTYAIIERAGKVIGRSYYQILHFNASKSLSPDPQTTTTKRSFFKTLSAELKNALAKNIDFYTLVNGNLLLTGDYSYEFDNEIPADIQIDLLRRANRSVRTYLESKHPHEIPVFLMKECYNQSRLPESYKKETSLHEFCIQPNFIMDIPSDWEHYEDYLLSLKAKYRIRANRARKKAEPVTTKVLDLEGIIHYQPQLYALYQNIANQIGFNMVNLNPRYFARVKEALGDQYEVVIFVKEGRVIGFYSYFLLDNEMVAHYVGFDPEYSTSHQLYLNMLLDLIDISIRKRKKSINLGRTAHEIKSSVGAIAVDMYCYIRHKNKMYQTMVPKLLDYLSPKEVWEPRHPFKDLE